MIKKSLARWQLIVYDLVIFAFTDLLLLVFYQGQERLPLNSILIHTVIGCVCIFAIRIAGVFISRSGGMVAFNVISACCLQMVWRFWFCSRSR